VSQRDATGRGSRVAGRGYQQLRAWQEAHELALLAFRSSGEFKARNRSLADQFVRSAVSVPANIAEGYNRGSLREYIQFLNIARGSLAETEYYVIFAEDAGLLHGDQIAALTTLVDDAGSLLLGLLRSLQTKQGGASSRMVREDGPPYVVDGGPVDLPATRDPRPATLPETS
jgi:four helix bundle protein